MQSDVEKKQNTPAKEQTNGGEDPPIEPIDAGLADVWAVGSSEVGQILVYIGHSGVVKDEEAQERLHKVLHKNGFNDLGDADFVSGGDFFWLVDAVFGEDVGLVYSMEEEAVGPVGEDGGGEGEVDVGDAWK